MKKYIVALLIMPSAVIGEPCVFGPNVEPAMLAQPVSGNVHISERYPGGEVSTQRWDGKAFSQSAPKLSMMKEAQFKAGNMFFRGQPKGLGPLFNATSCQGCHVQDGRGNVPMKLGREGDPMVSMFLRASVNGKPLKHYGDQLATFGIHDETDGSVKREVFSTIEYQLIKGVYPDGGAYELRQPIYRISDLNYGDFPEGVAFSPRVAPQMIGLGLLEHVPVGQLIVKHDPNDLNKDGISGRFNSVYDESTQQCSIGRFSPKSNAATILQQLAGAFRGDLGISNSIMPESTCTEAQTNCLKADKPSPKTDDKTLALVEFYSKHLAVPENRGYDKLKNEWKPKYLKGRKAFHETGCVGCHTAKMKTGLAQGSVLGEIDLLDLTQPAQPLKTLSNQTIYPYTDLLLHDMGGECSVEREGDEWVQRCSGLADGREDFQANGQEWRTAPLWGIGLTQTVNPRATFLHDGRARTIEEAILWHAEGKGSEASEVIQRFKALSKDERSALIEFVESL